mgnify:CR=1 FL=1
MCLPLCEVRIALHQPYLLPYRGWFDLIASVDKFVLGDDYQWIKGGWINRNNFPEPFTFRLAKHSSSAKINELYFFNLKEDVRDFKRKFPKLNSDKYLSLMQPSYNLSFNIYLVTKEICKDLGIVTPIYFSSQIPHGKFVGGVLDIVRALGGDTYVNAPGGRALYNQEMFGDIKLEFIEAEPSPSILCGL